MNNNFDVNKLTDDEALLIGIQEQNAKYTKLLEFVKRLHPRAKELLEEIGESE